MVVNFQDCQSDLLSGVGPEGIRAYQAWRNDVRLLQVVRFVENFSHSFLFDITPEYVAHVLDTSEHALGDVEKYEALRQVEDFTCPFAFCHVFHRYVEEKQELPTWQSFRRWILIEASEMFYEPFKQRFNWDGLHPDRKRALGRALRWRVGKLYYSSMREVDLLARLRNQHGIPVKYHIFADALLRIDMWFEDIIVCTYVPNSLYRDGVVGRKKRVEAMLNGGDRSLKVLHIEIPEQRRGKCWLVTEDGVSRLAAEIAKTQTT